MALQTHPLGDAAIPQKLRSLRNVRARPASPDFLGKPAKRQCTEGQGNDPNEAAIAEMLLGLSSSPRSRRGISIQTPVRHLPRH